MGTVIKKILNEYKYHVGRPEGESWCIMFIIYNQIKLIFLTVGLLGKSQSIL